MLGLIWQVLDLCRPHNFGDTFPTGLLLVDVSVRLVAVVSKDVADVEEIVVVLDGDSQLAIERIMVGLSHRSYNIVLPFEWTVK
jgi:hypothetical protein